jgi:hypothetical protein
MMMYRKTRWGWSVIAAVILGFLTTLPSHAQPAYSDFPARLATATPYPASTTLSCTFKVSYPTINLRSGPGQDFDWEGYAESGQELKVTGEATGDDGYIWWQAGTVWVRSDLGTSDCKAICGNDVCETGESTSSCAKDCQAATTSTGTGTGCVVPDCQACYESIWCYPNCSECTCSHNDYGCCTCYCSYPK